MRGLVRASVVGGWAAATTGAPFSTGCGRDGGAGLLGGSFCRSFSSLKGSFDDIFIAAKVDA